MDEAPAPALTPVVLLHSAGQTPQMWQPQVEAIDPATQVIAPWLAGLRPGRPGELSLPAVAVDVVTQLDRYGIERAVLVGHQLGALAALEVAATEPERVAGLVLSGALAIPGRMALKAQQAMIRMLPNRTLASSGATKDDLIKALQVIAGADLGDRLKQITIPVLVIAGNADPAIESARGLAAQLPNAEVEIVAGAGAYPSVEASADYNRLLTGFLAAR